MGLVAAELLADRLVELDDVLDREVPNAAVNR
jgi:hypothetical protein